MGFLVPKDVVMVSMSVREGVNVDVEKESVKLEGPQVEDEAVMETVRKDELTEERQQEMVKLTEELPSEDKPEGKSTDGLTTEEKLAEELPTIQKPTVEKSVEEGLTEERAMEESSLEKRPTVEILTKDGPTVERPFENKLSEETALEEIPPEQTALKGKSSEEMAAAEISSEGMEVEEKRSKETEEKPPKCEEDPSEEDDENPSKKDETVRLPERTFVGVEEEKSRVQEPMEMESSADRMKVDKLLKEQSQEEARQEIHERMSTGLKATHVMVEKADVLETTAPHAENGPTSDTAGQDASKSINQEPSKPLRTGETQSTEDAETSQVTASARVKTVEKVVMSPVVEERTTHMVMDTSMQNMPVKKRRLKEIPTSVLHSTPSSSLLPTSQTAENVDNNRMLTTNETNETNLTNRSIDDTTSTAPTLPAHRDVGAEETAHDDSKIVDMEASQISTEKGQEDQRHAAEGMLKLFDTAE